MVEEQEYHHDGHERSKCQRAACCQLAFELSAVFDVVSFRQFDLCVYLAGEAVSQVYEKGKSFDLTVRVKDNLRDEMEKIRNLMIDTGDGQKIPKIRAVKCRIWQAFPVWVK